MAADPPHVLILVPDPVYPEPWAWAFHVEAEALRSAGFEVSARPWTAPGELRPFDAVLPLVVWGYHERYAEWLSLLARLEAGGDDVDAIDLSGVKATVGIHYMF